MASKKKYRLSFPEPSQETRFHADKIKNKFDNDAFYLLLFSSKHNFKGSI